MSSSCFKQSPLVPKVSLVMFKLILSPSRFHSPSHSSGNSHSVKEINHLSVIFIKLITSNYNPIFATRIQVESPSPKAKTNLEFDLIDSIIFRIFIYLFLFLSGIRISLDLFILVKKKQTDYFEANSNSFSLFLQKTLQLRKQTILTFLNKELFQRIVLNIFWQKYFY